MARLRTSALLVLPLAVITLRAQPQFKTQTDLIEVPAVVEDAQGRPVFTVGRDDFEIREDGRPVSVATFASIDSDAAAATSDGRFVVLLLDLRAGPTAKKVAKMIAGRMTEYDELGAVALGGGTNRTTISKAGVDTQIDKLRVSPTMRAVAVPSIGAMPSEGCAECGNLQLGPMSQYGPFPGNSGPSWSLILDTISDLSHQIRKVPHRHKTLVFIGSAAAFGLTPENVMDGSSGQWFDALRNASRNDVTVDIIDPSGLGGSHDDGAQAFAAETGGRAFVNVNTFDDAVDRVWQDAGHYYLLGYEPVSKAKGRHSIDVRVKRPDVTVRARKTRA